jgi:hypothetical protein
MFWIMMCFWFIYMHFYFVDCLSKLAPIACILKTLQSHHSRWYMLCNLHYIYLYTYICIYVVFRQTQPNIKYLSTNRKHVCTKNNREVMSHSFNSYIYIILIHKWNKQHFYRNSSPVCSEFINERNVSLTKYNINTYICI